MPRNGYIVYTYRCDYHQETPDYECGPEGQVLVVFFLEYEDAYNYCIAHDHADDMFCVPFNAEFEEMPRV